MKKVDYIAGKKCEVSIENLDNGTFRMRAEVGRVFYIKVIESESEELCYDHGIKILRKQIKRAV